MGLFRWKKKECEECKVVERKLMGMWSGMEPIILELDARLKKLEAKKKPSAKKKRPQPVLKSKNN